MAASPAMSGVEIVSVAFGLVSIWLARAQNVWTWPTGIANVALQLVVVLGARIYLDAGLQVVFLVLSVYGWWQWLRPGAAHRELPVTRLGAAGALLVAATCLAGTLGLGALARGTGAAYPWGSAVSTALSLVAQFLLARKVLENWLLWIPADVLLVGMYASSRLYWLAGLYLVYLVLATSGFLAWRKSSRAPQAA